MILKINMNFLLTPNIFYLIFGVQDTRQMGQACDAVFLLYIFDDINGFVAAAAAGAVGAGNKIRF